MLKRLLLTLSISFALAVPGYSVPAAGATLPETPVETVVSEETTDNTQIEIPSEAVNSTEVNTIQESGLAKKMTQAEKANNVKENDEYGVALTIMAMCIVLFALVVLSILFLIFGKASSSLHSKKKLEAHGISKDEADDTHEDLDSGEVIAAIGLALAQHFDGSQDLEDTVLTIKRMKRAYSPWNSKIYNMRELPQLRKGK